MKVKIKDRIIDMQHVIYVSMSKLELRCKVLSSCGEQGLDELRLDRSARSGVKLVPMRMPTVCWEIVPPNNTGRLSITTSKILMIYSLQYTFCRYQSVPSRNMYPSVYLLFPFLKRMILSGLLVSMAV